MPSKAKYNTKQKEVMYERDNKCCILCASNQQLQFHHVYFGQEAMRTKDRNNSKYGITCCATCHSLIHSCAIGTGKRQKAIDYINNL